MLDFILKIVIQYQFSKALYIFNHQYKTNTFPPIFQFIELEQTRECNAQGFQSILVSLNGIIRCKLPNQQ